MAMVWAVKPTPIVIWCVLSAALIAWAAGLTANSPQFHDDIPMIARPIWPVTAALVVAGLAYAVGLPWLITRSAEGAGPSRTSGLVWLILATGLLARLVVSASAPILEDDFYRYLWDGAVTAHGHNPYQLSPDAILAQGTTGPLGALAARSGDILRRVGHGDVSTIYPPLCQLAFALSHLIAPWSLAGWKAILFVFDLATLALVLALLRALGRSELWVALYWWNPILIKETFNSAHMDVLVSPFVVGALLVAARRPLAATALIGCAIGLKFWPALLLPLIWRPLLANRAEGVNGHTRWPAWPARLAPAIAVLLPFAVAAVLPQILTRLDEDAGVVAYAQTWTRNSALYPALETGLGRLLAAVNLGNVDEALVLRAGLAAVVAAVAVWLAMRPIAGRTSPLEQESRAAGLQDLTERAIIAIATLFLLSPAQYPWYSLWFAPLLVARPHFGLLLLAATLPLYELSFHYAAIKRDDIFTGIVVWIVWVPVWAALAADRTWPRWRGAR